MKRMGAGGFSLVEVLVAMAIMALSLGAIYEVMSAVIGNVREAERHSRAVLLATSLLTRHETIPRGGLEAEGTEGADGNAFRWHITASPAGLPDGVRGWPLYRTEVRVRWDGARGEREFRLYTINLESPVPIR